MKKTRLLEIIREEIDNAINEIPFIGPASQYDFAYDDETGKIEKGILGNAIKNAIDVIKGMGIESTPEISKIIVGKKARTSPNSPPELVSALVAVDDAVAKQRDTFDDTRILNIVNKMANEPKSGIPDLSKFTSGEKTFSDKLQRPQTEKAIDRILNPKKTEVTEPTTSSEPKVTKVDSDDEAPSGDAEVEKAARGRDELVKQYRRVMDTYKEKKSTEGDKEALEYLKTKQDIVKKYKKAQKVEA